MPRPLKPNELRHFLQLIVINYGQTVLDVPQKTKGAITGSLAAEWPNDHDRRICINYLFSEPGLPVKEMSTKRLSDAQWMALKRWIGASREDETMPWENSPWFAEEARWVLWEVGKLERAEMKEAGQLEFPYVDPITKDYHLPTFEIVNREDEG